MSITSLPESTKLPSSKKQATIRTDSEDDDELDVFEAARYFSGYNEPFTTRTHSQHKVLMRDHPWRPSRRSLDVAMPMSMRDALQSQPPPREDPKHTLKEKKTYKQPRSPGGRLASFLNSLFNQSRRSKKKKSKSTTQSMIDLQHDEESPGGRRKRRSSISHFRSSNSDTKSLYSSSSSGFRTPPPYNLQTSVKSHSDHRNKFQVASSLRPSENKRINDDLAWLDEKLKFIDGLSTEKSKKNGKHGTGKERKDLRSFINNEDDGNESDSSSDLFELENYDFGIYSSGLPVYETTHMDKIKKGPVPL